MFQPTTLSDPEFIKFDTAPKDGMISAAEIKAYLSKDGDEQSDEEIEVSF